MPPIYPEKHAFRIDYSKLSINEIYLALSKVGSPYVTWWASHVGVIIEIFLCIPILAYIKYTEIDWSTYMQQVDVFLSGELNYTNIKGDTGPVVYPAGHLYFYSIFYFITNRGVNIVLGQFLFYFLYIATLSVVFYLCSLSSRFPALGIFVMIFTGYRIHSIFMLRMFNDCIAMFFLYLSIAILVYLMLDDDLPKDVDVQTVTERTTKLFQPLVIDVPRKEQEVKTAKNVVGQAPNKGNRNRGKNKYESKPVVVDKGHPQSNVTTETDYEIEPLTLEKQQKIRYYLWMAAVVYSIGLSIKMNLLLFAPGIGAFVFVKYGFYYLMLTGTSVIAVQLFLAVPFFCSCPYEYIISAFNFGRVFLYKWTVNWRCIDEELFLDKRFHLFLLGLHIFFLVFIAFTLWFRERGGLWKLLWARERARVSIHEMLVVIFTSNLIGISFARSLHYQFYSWYYHSFVYLILSERTEFETLNEMNKMAGLFVRISMVIGMEICWNTYPSTPQSSLLLHCLHLGCFILLYRAHRRSKKHLHQQ